MLRLYRLWIFLAILMISCTVSFCKSFSYDHERARKVLGYDPDITMHNSKNNNPDAYPTIYVHGFGDTGENFYQWKNCEQCVLGPAMTFNLPDHQLLSNVFAFFKSSFGQWSDIAPTLYVLKLCRDAGYKRVDLFGLSRGGATIINLLAVLNNNSYSSRLRIFGPSLQKLGIDEQARKDILTMIQAGCITVDVPIKHLYYTLKNMVRTLRIGLFNAVKNLILGSSGHEQLSASIKKRSIWRRFMRTMLTTNITGNTLTNLTGWKHGIHAVLSKIGSAFDNFGALALNYIVLPVACKYKPWREQPIYSAQQLKGLRLNILLNIEKRDNMVFNQGDRQLYRALRSHNPCHTYCVISSDGGHVATRQQLPSIYNSFKSIYGYTSHAADKPAARAMLAAYKIDPRKLHENYESCTDWATIR